jgi:hypothetical protein
MTSRSTVRFIRALALALIVLLFGEMPVLAAPTGQPPRRDPASLPPLASADPAERQVDVPTGDFSQPPPMEGVPATPTLPDGPLPKNAALASGATVAARTENTTVFDNHNGTSTAFVHAGAVNFRDQNGTWRAIDPTLRPAGGQYETNATPFGVRLGAKTDAGNVATIAGDGWSFGFRLAGQAEGRAASVDKNAIRYSEVSDGVDLEEHVSAIGLKEQLVLKRRPASDNGARFRFPLAMENLSAKADEDGAIGIYDRSGAKVLVVPPGWAVDSNGSVEQGLQAVAPVQVSLVEAGKGGSAIELSVDPAWLQDPARVYPVSIDPTVVFNAGRASAHWDSFASQSQPTTNFNGYVEANAYSLKVGIPAAGQQYYSYMKYDMSALAGHSIVSEFWNGLFYSANTYSGEQLRDLPSPWELV